MDNMNGANSLEFLYEILESCRERNIVVWTFGGWAEELWGMCNPRIHNDVDLLCPASDFCLLDAIIQGGNDWEEISLKRFPHKRAIKVQDIMIEFFLISIETGNAFTDFFGRFRFDWPADTLDYTTSLLGSTVNIASQDALVKYRNENDYVRRAHREYIAEKGVVLDRRDAPGSQ